jgi:hypothetical protein
VGRASDRASRTGAPECESPRSGLPFSSRFGCAGATASEEPLSAPACFRSEVPESPEPLDVGRFLRPVRRGRRVPDESFSDSVPLAPLAPLAPGAPEPSLRTLPPSRMLPKGRERSVEVEDSLESKLNLWVRWSWWAREHVPRWEAGWTGRASAAGRRNPRAGGVSVLDRIASCDTRSVTQEGRARELSSLNRSPRTPMSSGQLGAARGLG